MTVEQEDVVIRKILGSPSRIVNITGGEPMIDGDRCCAIIKKLYDGGKKVYLSTNARHGIGELDFLSKYVSLLGLPLDGYDLVSNSVCGRNEGSFDEVINMLSVLDARYKHANVKIGTVVTRLNNNEKTLFGIFNVISRFSCVKTWRLYEFIPVNRGAAHAELALSSDERSETEKLVLRMRAERRHVKIEFATRVDRGFAYFIILPNGTVIMPTESEGKAGEEYIGDLVAEEFDTVAARWKERAHAAEYIAMRATDVIGDKK